VRAIASLAITDHHTPGPPRSLRLCRDGSCVPQSISEVYMRAGTVILIIWFIIGAIAAGQRGYYGHTAPSCSNGGTIIVTILAGPLNYIGANPKVVCH
jgi:membrane protein YdbS with pleckstrin-like domain